jgi:hypothetical protein
MGLFAIVDALFIKMNTSAFLLGLAMIWLASAGSYFAGYSFAKQRSKLPDNVRKLG